MATQQQLVELLRGQSHINGWSAIAIFDGSVISPMLSDYFAPMVHGTEGARPLPADRIELTPSGEYIATMDKFVMAAPRLSLRDGTLEDSRVRVIFDFYGGVYTEESVVAGATDVLTRYTNLAASAGHTFSFDIDLAEARGWVDKHGTAWLTLGGAYHPACTIGSTALAKDMLAERLLEVVTGRGLLPVRVPLGTFIHKRRWLRPTGFRLRVQHQMASAENALVVFISGADGLEGNIPEPAAFPWLLPDDRNPQGDPYSATLLIAREHQKLQEGEAQQLFGQILFPSERNFKASSVHDNTKDVVVFGRLEPLAAGNVALAPLDEKGSTAHLQTLVRGAGPVALTASQSIVQGWTWELPAPALGTLTPQPNTATAVYTRPEVLPQNTRVTVQRVVAIHAATGRRIETCFVLQGVVPTVALSRSFFTAPPPSVNTEVFADYDPSDSPTVTWRVLGRGTVDPRGASARYYAPADPGDDMDLLICELSIEMAGAPFIYAYGYCIAYLGASAAQDPQWSSLTPFTLEATSQNAPLFANGLQQLEIVVKVGTGTGQRDITDAEFATLRLAVRGGAEIPQIAATLEGLVGDADGVVPQWGYSMQRNGFELATNDSIRLPVNRPSRGAVREKRFYLQTLSPSPQTFVAKITAADNSVHASDDNGQGEGSNRTLLVTPRTPLAWQHELNPLERLRVEGGSVDRSVPPDPQYTPTFPNYDWYLTTCDYWTLRHWTTSPVLPIEIRRLEWLADQLPLRWESEQNAEDLFSYLGVALIKSRADPEFVDFASVLYDPLLHNSDSFTGTPQFARIKHENAPSVGQLLVTVNRVTDIFWRQRALIAAANGGAFEFDQPATFNLWDKFGNKMTLQLRFEGSERNKIDVRSI